MKRKTHEQYVQELAEKNPMVEVIGQYIDNQTSILHKCKIDGNEWMIKPNNILHGKGCPVCHHRKLGDMLRKTHDKYIQELLNINSHIKVLEQYIDSKTPILHYCEIHDTLWRSSPDSVLHGGGCKECHYVKVRDKLRRSHEEYVGSLNKINPDIEVIESYINAKTPILHKCKIHNIIWRTQPCHILEGHGCPLCNASYGEKQIEQWLCNHNVEYMPQKTFNDCKDQRVLPFDFYLPLYNICIEYDGEQHFRPVDFFGGEAGFKQRKLHDAIKTEYCKNNNIRLLRIPYFKNIEEELENFLFI